MPDETPKSRPEPPAPAKPSVYGDQWGSSGKQNEGEDRGQTDRPKPIETPPRSIGTGDPEGPPPA